MARSPVSAGANAAPAVGSTATCPSRWERSLPQNGQRRSPRSPDADRDESRYSRTHLLAFAEALKRSLLCRFAVWVRQVEYPHRINTSLVQGRSMAHLLRIVMIHGHLEGVVELNVNGHTNICGTNASGKTTLQRLIPVFYGELPNRVVPKTRLKFDAFYLPHRNSYLIYEYRREDGDICQAVLTRKSEGGVEYRFVAAPYRPEDYLVQSEDRATAEIRVTALEYAQWLSGLRRQGITTSNKLGATSEYRAVIQNDFAQYGAGQGAGRREVLRLRQDAVRFSLVRAGQRIRHMEKLVSAVHAKEGKMDTLKTMLAAIFEEDGVELPVTRVRNTKAREWIARMRQSMRLAPLQEALETLQSLERDIADLEASLWQLRPQLEADRHRAERTSADLEAELNQRQREFQTHEQAHEETRGELNARISELDSELDQRSEERRVGKECRSRWSPDQ